MTIENILPNLLSDNSKGLKRSEIREILKLVNQPGVISLAGGLPFPGVFPVEEMKDVAQTVLSREGTQAMQYGNTEGDPKLLDFIVKWMEEHEGAKGITSENILVVSGSQQALDLVGRLFINPGDRIIVGLPSYLGALQAFNSYRAKPIGVPLDDHGIRVDKVEEALQKAAADGEQVKFIYVIPDFQNPAGVTLSKERRLRLLELAEQYKTVIVEDSPYRDLRFEGDHIPTISTLDTKGISFSLHTFSKIFAPGTRLGWIVANKTIMDKFVMAKQPADLCSAPFTQAMVAEFCHRGMLIPHIEKIVDLYGKKRNVMLEALEKYMPKDAGIKWTRPEGGMFSWVTLPEKVDTVEIFPKAIEKKVAYVVGSAFHFDGSGKNTMRLNFSFPSEEQIDEGIKRLADLFKEVL